MSKILLIDMYSTFADHTRRVNASKNDDGQVNKFIYNDPVNIDYYDKITSQGSILKVLYNTGEYQIVLLSDVTGEPAKKAVMKWMGRQLPEIENYQLITRDGFPEATPRWGWLKLVTTRFDKTKTIFVSESQKAIGELKFNGYTTFSDLKNISYQVS
jgi:hypothetical protein